MAKYHKYSAVLLNIVFLGVIQQFSFPQPVFRLLLLAFVGFACVVCVYNYYYLRSIQRVNAWALLRPVLFYASVFGLANIAASGFLRGLLLFAAFVAGSFFEIFLGNFAENVLLNETIIIAFGMYMTLSAYAILYAPAYSTLYCAAVFIGTYLTLRAFYEYVPESAASKLVMSMSIALLCAELFWALSFLPFHYSVAAILLLNAFYFCLVLSYYYAFNIITIRKLQLHLLLFTAIALLVLITTPWKIIT